MCLTRIKYDAEPSCNIAALVGEILRKEEIPVSKTTGMLVLIFMDGQEDALADNVTLEAYDDNDDAGEKRYFAVPCEMVLVRSDMKSGEAYLTFPVGTTVGDAKRLGAKKCAAGNGSSAPLWTGKNMSIFMEAEGEIQAPQPLSDDVELEAGPAYVALTPRSPTLAVQPRPAVEE